MESWIVWGLSLVVAALIFVPYFISFRRTVRAHEERKEEASQLGIDRPVAQYPFIDAELCIGCGSCVDACPEGDVLGVVGGTATVINGLRCVGHARCEIECPVGAIEVGLGDVKSRSDLPLLDPDHESSVPGVFVVGEAGGLALIRYAVAQGQHAVESIASGLDDGSGPEGSVDVVIVGAGPAGLAAAMAARERGLSSLVLEQESSLGGSILHYPRRKLVLTQPVGMPLGESIPDEEYLKEDLVDLFESWVRRHDLDLRLGHRVVDVERNGHGFWVKTSGGTVHGKRVVLAIGRRGTPRKLGVPGEDRETVMYRLLDADSYQGSRILVVGGGDSAVEAAIGLARDGQNEVTLSYRRDRLLRIKHKNQVKIDALIAAGKVRTLFPSNVRGIDDDAVVLETGDSEVKLPVDYVFVFIGGEPHTPFLKRIGMRFGGADAATEGRA